METWEMASDRIYLTMLALAQFPAHEQKEQFTSGLGVARLENPDLYAEAQARFDQVRHARSLPCSTCQGSGVFEWEGKGRFCGCRAGDKAMRTGVVPVVARPAVVMQMPKPEKAMAAAGGLRRLA